MSDRKRTADAANLDDSKQPSSTKKKFNPPKIVKQQKWNKDRQSARNRLAMPHHSSRSEAEWRCAHCYSFNLKEYVFCQECTAEPPAHEQMHVPQQTDFKTASTTTLDNHRHHNHHNSNDREHSNRKLNHIHNTNASTKNNNSLFGGYPDHEIHFEYIADATAKQYCKFIERNIRREQNHHIEQYKQYLQELLGSYSENRELFMRHFTFQLCDRDVDHDDDTHAFVIKIQMQRTRSLERNPSNNISTRFNDLTVGTSVLAICACQFDEMTGIGQFFERAVHGTIEEVSKTSKRFQLEIAVTKDNYNVLKQYALKNNLGAHSQSFAAAGFCHSQPQCPWIVCSNHLGFFEQQLRQLDVFINATIYQMPHKLFEYLYHVDDAWLTQACNASKLREFDAFFSGYSLNASQQLSIAKALLYPLSLIHGPPGCGKTVTIAYLCDVILAQQLKSDHEVICITAHSHAACDQILNTFIAHQKSLRRLDVNRIARFGSLAKIGKHLKSYSFQVKLKKQSEYSDYVHLQKNGLADQAKECLLRIAENLLMEEIDIVVTTCYGCSNSLLMKSNVPISHLIVDEATQIVESELLIAFNLLRDRRRSEHTMDLNNVNRNYFSAVPPYRFSSKPLDVQLDMRSPAPAFEIDLDDFSKKIVMIGDPKQLSPTVQSAEAAQHGYGISLFERLLGSHSIASLTQLIRKLQKQKYKTQKSEHGEKSDLELYAGFNKALQAVQHSAEFAAHDDRMQELVWQQRQQQRPCLDLQSSTTRSAVNYTLLNVQYRMPPFMMQFCNDQFYNSCIQSAMSADDACAIGGIDWGHPHKSVLFVSLENSTQTKTAAMSYYNAEECRYIGELVARVLHHNRGVLHAHDIGIIAMHRAQVVELEKSLHANRNIEGSKIDVHTIDGFQGKEKKLIIVSFVRTDGFFTSFLGNPKRCNVALTRARYGLVVVGQLKQLKANRMWRKFASFAERHDLVMTVESNSQCF